VTFLSHLLHLIHITEHSTCCHSRILPVVNTGISPVFNTVTSPVVTPGISLPVDTNHQSISGILANPGPTSASSNSPPSAVAMEAAKAAVKDFMAKSGHHDTTVHEKVAPAVTHETIERKEHENVQTAIGTSSPLPTHPCTFPSLRPCQLLVHGHLDLISRPRSQCFLCMR
jgi:hypothetical protein